MFNGLAYSVRDRLITDMRMEKGCRDTVREMGFKLEDIVEEERDAEREGAEKGME